MFDAASFLLAALFTLLIISIPVLFKNTGNLPGAVITGMIGLAICLSAIPGWIAPSTTIAPAPFSLTLAPIAFHIDSLAAVFLSLLGVLTVCTSIFAPGYLSEGDKVERRLDDKVNRRLYWSGTMLFVSGMAAVICAANAVTFLVCWEIMSLASAALVVAEYRRHSAQKAAMIYLVATRIATALLSAGFIWMFCLSQSWDFAAWRFDAAATYPAATLILLGLAIKAGAWPCHIWLPYAHPAAPAPVSALMSGVMVKVAIYALLRLLVFGGFNSLPVIYCMFAAGLISAFWGILFASMQTDLKRLLAYSTVENVGLMILSIALILWARTQSLAEIAQLAFAALLFHVIAHGLSKGLLFLCAGSVDHAAHTREFGKLGGLVKRMPLTAVAFTAGSVAIAALPPLSCFASKWCLYQALFKSVITMPSLFDRAFCMGTIAMLAAIGALAVACFCKATAVAFLGVPRTPAAASAHESKGGMLLAQLLLVSSTIGLSFAFPVGFIIARPLIASVVPGSPYLLHGDLTLPLGTVFLLLSGLAAGLYYMVLDRKPNRYITWECGFGNLTPKTQVTPDSFVQPLARIFTPLLRYRVSLDITGKDRRHFPEHITVEPSMVSLLETVVYTPLARGFTGLSRWVGRLQAGSIHLYLLYVCLTLVALLLVGTRL